MLTDKHYVEAILPVIDESGVVDRYIVVVAEPVNEGEYAVGTVRSLADPEWTGGYYTRDLATALKVARQRAGWVA